MTDLYLAYFALCRYVFVRLGSMQFRWIGTIASTYDRTRAWAAIDCSHAWTQLKDDRMSATLSFVYHSKVATFSSDDDALV